LRDAAHPGTAHPRHPLATLSQAQRQALYEAILGTVAEVIAHGGRNDEFDFYNLPGGYVRVMDSRAAGRPCLQCGTAIEKIQ
jgi:formamidopyrimidine-DNA glycosylase